MREDALQLYGFLTDLERQLFERLIGISGIGPKLAIAVLSGMDSREVIAAVQRADVARLTGIPGVGKKTAERIVLELKDRLTQTRVAGRGRSGDRRSGTTGCATTCSRRSRTSAIIDRRPRKRSTPR